MSDMHSFSVDVAKEVGVNAAILLQSIKWWCLKNRANGKHYHDGLYWTYNSVKAWQELYPYLGKKAIDNALKKLEGLGYIAVGNHNKSAYDKTKWYAITQSGLSLFDSAEDSKGETHFPKGEMENAERGNGEYRNGEPIPVTNQLHSADTLTDSNGAKHKKSGFNPPTREEVRAYVKEKGYHFDPDHFFDYYDASNWHLQGGKRVTRWKQCCVTWERNAKGKQGESARIDFGSEFGTRGDECFG